MESPKSQSSANGYRPDVDGLRAIAVLAVLLFHLDESILPGGYVGVDIFFVISGYLITGVIVSKLQNNDFRLADFYVRRIKRILPALWFMLVCVGIAGFFLFLPEDFRNLGKHTASAAASISNIVFWTEFDYFRASDFVKPTLHTWSLGIEEQFYLAFPLVLVAAYRFACSLRIVIGTLLIGSFVANLVWMNSDPSGGYYLPMCRFWELLVGSFISVLRSHFPIQRRTNEIASFTGITCIGTSFALFDESTVFPGWNAWLPCLGAGLLIVSGANGVTVLKRLFSQPALTAIGKISYSMYLWHWPLIVFARYVRIHPLTNVDKIIICLGTFCLSYLSWKYIENPFRYRTTTRVRVFFTAALTSWALIGFGAVVFATDGIPSRVPQHVVRIAAASESPHVNEFAEPIQYVGSPTRIYFMGDSHCRALIGTLRSLAEEHDCGIAVSWNPARIPLIGLQRPNYPLEDVHAEFMTVLNHPEIEMVVLIARWPLYLEGFSGDIGPDAETPNGCWFLDADRQKPRNRNHETAIFRDAVIETINMIHSYGKQAVVMTSTPEVGYHVPTALAKTEWFSGSMEDFTLTASLMKKRQHRTQEAIRTGCEQSGATIIDPRSLFIDENDCLILADGMAPLFSDDNHLSKEGAEKLRDLIRSTTFSKVMATD